VRTNGIVVTSTPAGQFFFYLSHRDFLMLPFAVKRRMQKEGAVWTGREIVWVTR